MDGLMDGRHLHMSKARSWSNLPNHVVHWGWVVTGFILRAMEVGSRGWGSGEWGRRERGMGEEIASPSGSEIRWAH